MEERGADSGRTWWNDRQPRFTLLVIATYALLVVVFEAGLGCGDRINLRGGGAGVYLLVIAFYGLIANVCYELIARVEGLAKPKNVAAYRRRMFVVAVVLGIVIPVVVGALF